METFAFVFGVAMLAGIFATLVQIAGTLGAIDRKLSDRDERR